MNARPKASSYGMPALQSYQQVGVVTASPHKLLLMLYDGALRFCKQAKVAMARGQIAERARYIGKVQAILEELASSLDHSVAPELCEQLAGLYLYCLTRLTKANISNDVSIVEEVESIFMTLRDGWQQANVAVPVDARPATITAQGERAAAAEGL